MKDITLKDKKECKYSARNGWNSFVDGWMDGWRDIHKGGKGNNGPRATSVQCLASLVAMALASSLSSLSCLSISSASCSVASSPSQQRKKSFISPLSKWKSSELFRIICEFFWCEGGVREREREREIGLENFAVLLELLLFFVSEFVQFCVCVCVCVRERERERERGKKTLK